MSAMMVETISLLPPPVRRQFEVTSVGAPPVRVRGTNWLQALGVALAGLGLAAVPARMAAETLPNGTVIARDVEGGARYVVRPLA